MASPIKTIEVDATKRSGFPAMWERWRRDLEYHSGVLIITDEAGNPPVAAYTTPGKDIFSYRSNALVCIHPRYYIIEASLTKRGKLKKAVIKRIISTTVRDVGGEYWDASASVVIVNSFEKGTWSSALDEKFIPAINAVKKFIEAGKFSRQTIYVSTTPKRVPKEIALQRNENAKRRLSQRELLIERRELQENTDFANSVKAQKSGLGAEVEALKQALIEELYPENIISIGKGFFTMPYSYEYHLFTRENVDLMREKCERLLDPEREGICERRLFMPTLNSMKDLARSAGIEFKIHQKVVSLIRDGETIKRNDFARVFVFSEAGMRKLKEFLEQEAAKVQ